MIKGKIHRLSEKALELLNLERVAPQEPKPILMQKLPPNLEILKIQKAAKTVTEPVVEVTKTITEVEKVAEPVVEVKKNEDVIAENTVKPKRKHNGKVGVKK